MTTFRDIYTAHRHAAAAAYGTDSGGGFPEAQMSGRFAASLVDSWRRLGGPAALKIEGAAPLGYESALRSFERLKSEGPGLAADVDERGLVRDPSRLWQLVGSLASELDTLGAAPSGFEAYAAAFKESAQELASKGTEAVTSVLQNVADALRVPLLIVGLALAAALALFIWSRK